MSSLISSYPAPAKLNLFLHVVGRRADGYHLLESVFQLFDFGDTIDIALRQDGAIRRITGRAGGTEGGMTTGEVLRVRAAMKPISTVPRALQTVDTATGEAAVAINQRSDVCAVPAAGVVAEAMVAMVLAEATLEKFGGDSVSETRRNAQAYLKRLADRGLSPSSAT